MKRDVKRPKGEGDLVRFGISIPRVLIDKFDQLLEEKDLGNRSEAIRELIRERLTQESWSAGRDQQSATMTLVVENKGETIRRVQDLRRELGQTVQTVLQTRAGDREELFVFVMRGSGVSLRQQAERLLGLRGVIMGKLVMAGMPAGLAGTK
ncbi:MAG: ribbon-helix-helix protein, CopG family [Planctomycetota bacterium]|nr:ribbon-helix-helix protein, CopG family [Planctomycetota bacterium]